MSSSIIVSSRNFTDVRNNYFKEKFEFLVFLGVQISENEHETKPKM